MTIWKVTFAMAVNCPIAIIGLSLNLQGRKRREQVSNAIQEEETLRKRPVGTVDGCPTNAYATPRAAPENDANAQN